MGALDIHRQVLRTAVPRRAFAPPRAPAFAFATRGLALWLRCLIGALLVPAGFAVFHCPATAAVRGRVPATAG
jgi:hypothetical protein